jgi:hypothetical protein
MKVAMEIGETLDVALIDGDRMVGTLSLSLKGVNVVKQVKAAAAAVSHAVATGKGRKRGGKRRVSAESRARMAEAQRKRWAKFHAGKSAK